jgi:phenylalanyl-tRNA synthetase alpha chain
MLEDIAAIEVDAGPRIAAAATLDELRSLDQELLGKRSPLSSFKSQLGALDADGRREVGGALNRVRGAIEASLAARRGELEAVARRQQLANERLDLTEVVPDRGAGHLHLVTQAIETLEDVFIGWASPSPRGPRWRPTGTTSAP